MDEGNLNFVIIHPGTYNLYVGFPDDTEPICIPHVVAYRLSNQRESITESQPNFDNSSNQSLFIGNLPITPIHDFTAQPLQEVVKTLKLLNGESHVKFDYNQASYNEANTYTLDISDKDNNVKSYDMNNNMDEFIFGNDVLNMDPELHKDFVIKWLYKDIINKEDQNLLTESEKRLISIHWMYSLNKLSTLKDNNTMNCANMNYVLLIPDFFNRTSIIDMMDILLKDMGFSGGIVIQESVAVSYFARCQSVCVVDVGHSKTSICCVEEGISLPISRIKLNMGGSTVSSVLYSLLKSVAFPVKHFDPFYNPYHFQKLEHLKKVLCHLKHDGAPGKVYDTEWNASNSVNSKKIQFMLGEEPLLAPIVYFSRPFLTKIDINMAKTFQYYEYNTDDDILNQNNFNDGIFNLNDATTHNNVATKNTLIMQENGNPTNNNSKNDGSNGMNNFHKFDLPDQPYTPLKLDTNVLSLDEAIIKSILTCDNYEQQSRMFSNIYVVGGGFIFEGADDFLQYRIEALLPRGKKYRDIVVDVINKFVDCHPYHAAWKGGCNLSQIESINEFLITAQQWNYHGVQTLREQCLFQWSNF